MIYLNDFAFPSMPERISVNCGASYLTYNLLSRKAAIPNGTDIKAVKWSGVFFGRKRRRTVLVQEWVSPEECLNFIEDSLSNGTVMNLIVEEAPINLDVTVSKFSYEPMGAFGDIEYTLELQEAKTLKVYTTIELNLQPLAKTVETRPEPQQGSSGQSYTIVSGDNLWKIARKFYGGSGGDWQKIYSANAAIIEATAKQHGKSSSDNGKWIYPGCVLAIP